MSFASPEPTVVERPPKWYTISRWTANEQARITHRRLRVLAMFWAFAFGIIGLAAGSHAYDRSNTQKKDATNHFPIPNTRIGVHTLDIIQAGTVLTVGCGALMFSSLVGLLGTYYRLPLYKPSQEGWQFLLWTIWILASGIAVTIIAANGTVTASGIDLTTGMMLPDGEVYPNLTIDIIYWHHGYLRFFAIVAWPTFLFSLIATWVSFLSTTGSTEFKEVKA